MINRGVILQEQSFESQVALLAQDFDEYKLISQLQGGTGGLIGMLTDTGLPWDYEAAFSGSVMNEHEIELVYTSKYQKHPILNPFIDIYLGSYKVSGVDIVANMNNGTGSLAVLQDETDPQEEYVQRFYVRVTRYSGYGNYDLRIKAGAFGSEGCELEVKVTNQQW